MVVKTVTKKRIASIKGEFDTYDSVIRRCLDNNNKISLDGGLSLVDNPNFVHRPTKLFKTNNE